MIASMYEIKDVLGSGGSGVVYLGWHMRLNKGIVLKADMRSLSESTLASLRREADMLKNLSHAHIPQIYDFTIEDGIVYTVMDYIEGESLDAALERGARFSSRQVVKWGAQVADAIAYLHSRAPHGILHSDIKPANMILTPQGDVKLIDFNISLALGEEGAVSIGRSQGYASPEHYGGAVLDERSDIFGLGAALYHLLTGRCPSKDARDTPPLTREDCPQGLADIINKAMSPDKDSRYQTAEAMLSALTNIRRSDPRARRLWRRRITVAAATAAILSLGIFTAFTGLKRLERDREVEALVEASRNALAKNDKTGAIKLALAAVPDKPGLFVPPVSAGAKHAMAAALGVYNFSEGQQLHRTLVLPSVPLMADLSPDGKTAAVVYAFETAVIEMDSGQTMFTVPMVQSAMAEARFLDDTTLVCAGRGGICAYDFTAGKLLWVGESATAIALSDDGGTIAAINRGDTFATLYDKNGNILRRVDFDGRNQRIPANDTIWNPRDKLFALSGDGRFLAISFADGTLSVFDASDPEIRMDIVSDAVGYIRYEGGFSGNLLAFSATRLGGSDFAVFDMATLEKLGGLNVAKRFGIVANKEGIYVSSDNLVVKLDPFSGEQQEMALTQAGEDIGAFSSWNGYTVAAYKGGYSFFDRAGSLISRFESEKPTDIAILSGGYAIIGGRDGTEMTVLRMDHLERFFTFDPGYRYHEARVSSDGSRFTLFSVDGFRLCDAGGAVIREQAIPSPDRVRDQQYIKSSGNLAVIWPDALTIYSGRDGAELFSEAGLLSVFYAPYGASVLDAHGHLRLVDLDSGTVTWSGTVDESACFAAYCGIAVDNAFLGGKTLIGAAKTSDGWVFAASDGANGAVYDGTGRKRFDFKDSGSSEAFFTETAAIISPLHGTPAVYSLGRGRKLADLESDAYLTYVTPMGDCVVSQYISTGGERFGVLLDAAFHPIARLPHLCDTWNGHLIFDGTGILYSSRVYSIEDMVALARAATR